MLGSFYFIVCSTEFVVCRRDGVLGRQADDHDDANLHVDAVQEAAGIGVEQGRQLADDDKQKIICKLKKGRIPCGTRPSSIITLRGEPMCRHRTISVFIVPYRPNKANRNYVRRRDSRFVEHSFFLCEKSA